MKYISTNGGPVIGLHCGMLDDWAGTDRKRFVDVNLLTKNDYTAACDCIHPANRLLNDVEILSGVRGHAFLLSSPYDTAVIKSDRISAYIAQAIYSEADWTFDEIRLDSFEEAKLIRSTEDAFRCADGTIVMFDAAFSGSNISEKCLTFDLSAGLYGIESATYEPDDDTGLILYKLTKL